MEQVVVAAGRPVGALQLGLGGRGPADTMGQGLRRPDRHGRERQGGEGETAAWAREHSDSERRSIGPIQVDGANDFVTHGSLKSEAH